MEALRLDKWLWAARFFKTRARAKAAIIGGKVQVNGIRAKAAKDLKLGDTLVIRRGDTEQIVEVTALDKRRKSATEAGVLYQETEDSIHKRETERARNRMERAGLIVPQSKPTKRGRREIKKLKTEAADE